MIRKFFQANSRIKFIISNFPFLSSLLLYVILIYSLDLYSQNKIEVRIQSREKIKSIRIEAANFSKRISVGLSSEVFLEIPDYGERIYYFSRR